MPIASPKYPFTSVALNGAPGDSGDRGVYLLWDGTTVLYIGKADAGTTIQSQLIDHYARKLAPSRATHYSWELCRHPILRHEELIKEHVVATGSPPRFNMLGAPDDPSFEPSPNSSLS